MANPNGDDVELRDPAAPYNVITFGGNEYLVTPDTLPQVYQTRVAYLENQLGTKLTFDERAAENNALRQLSGLDNGFYEYNKTTGQVSKVRDIGSEAALNAPLINTDSIANSISGGVSSVSNFFSKVLDTGIYASEELTKSFGTPLAGVTAAVVVVGVAYLVYRLAKK